jgi:hypothetical protein
MLMLLEVECIGQGAKSGKAIDELCCYGRELFEAHYNSIGPSMVAIGGPLQNLTAQGHVGVQCTVLYTSATFAGQKYSIAAINVAFSL